MVSANWLQLHKICPKLSASKAQQWIFQKVKNTLSKRGRNFKLKPNSNDNENKLNQEYGKVLLNLFKHGLK